MRAPRLLLGAALLLVAEGTWAAIELTANGSGGTVQVVAESQIELMVEAEDCPADADRWRHTWSDVDGIGLPNPGTSVHQDSLCDDSPTQMLMAPTATGFYEVRFQAEWCRNGSAGPNVFPCPTSQAGGTQYAIFEQEVAVTIEVIPPPDILLLADGVAGHLEVAPGDEVTLDVEANNCPDDADRWRDTWIDHHGVGLTDTGQTNDMDSVCDRTVSQTFSAPTAPGSYEITFEAESCEDGLWLGFIPVACPTNADGGTQYEPFGDSTVTIEVVEDGECAAGEGTGLLGNYWQLAAGDLPEPAIPTSEPDASRVDPTVNFDWGGGSPAGVNDEYFVVQWRGWIRSRCAGTYNFRTNSDDGIRVYIDAPGADDPIIGNWTDHAATHDTGSVTLPDAGTRYPIVVEYYENGGDAVAQLEWQPVTEPGGGPESSYEIVPESQLYPELSEPGGLVVYYRMDEDTWSGTSGEVLDSASDAHGTAQGDAATDGLEPAIDDDPGTCRYGQFDGSGYVQVDDLSDTLNGTATLAFWIRTTQTGNDSGWQAPGVAGVEQEGGADDIFWGWLDGSGRIGVSVGNDYDPEQKSTAPINDGAWHHVVLSRDDEDGSTQIWIDGNPDQSGSTGAGIVSTGYGSIGRIEQSEAPEDLSADLDEVRVYDRVLSDSDVIAIYRATHPCTGLGVDRFLVNHDGAGINCRPEPVTVTAVDAGGDPVADYSGTVDLSTNTDNGNWSVATGAGTLSNGGDDDGAAEYVFNPDDEGEVALLLENSHEETVDIDVSDGSAMDDDGEGGLVFRPYGFELTPSPVPTQVAGRPFTVELAAVGELPTDPGCDVIEEYSGTRDVALWFDYENPTSGTMPVEADGTPLAESSSAASEQAIMFADGVAEIELVYADAGAVQLHARDDAGIGEPPAGTDSEIVAGGTAPFVVRPFGFGVEVENDGAETGPTGALLARAGEPFAVTVTARAWDSADDADDDGVPDSGADLGDNDKTPNFGSEDPAESVVIDYEVADPTGGADGTLSNGTFADFDVSPVGEDDRDLTWSEVGYLNLYASLAGSDYLASGEDVTGAAAMVGRFAPDHFTLSDKALTNRVNRSCTAPASFTYLGEAFATDFTLTARNRAGITTTNYAGMFARLDSSEELNFGATGGGDDLTGRLDVSGLVFGWMAGTADLSAHVALARQEEESPLAPLRVGIAPQDEDGVSVEPSQLDLAVTSADSHGETAAPELRFGRLVIDDAAGAEIAPIDVPLRLQYWTGDTWVINEADDCTRLDLATETVLDNGDATVDGEQPIAVDAGTTRIENATAGELLFAAGRSIATFSAPEEGNTGWVDFAALQEEAGSGYSFLLGEWRDDENDWDDAPSGRISFGIYRGDDRWIDIRRVRAH